MLHIETLYFTDQSRAVHSEHHNLIQVLWNCEGRSCIQGGVGGVYSWGGAV